MSATKNKAIEKLNEPAKPTAARKKAIKKAVTAVVERQAVEVAPAEVITVTAEPIITTPAEPIKETPAVNIEPTEPTPTIKQKAAALWHKWGWAVMAFMVVLLALLIYDWIHVVQINKQLRQTQQVESKVAGEKDSLNRTAIEVEIKHKAVDSALEADAIRLSKSMAAYKEFHAQMNANNPTYKKENNEMQSRIFDTVNNSNDARRQRARELSGQK